MLINILTPLIAFQISREHNSCFTPERYILHIFPPTSVTNIDENYIAIHVTWVWSGFPCKCRTVYILSPCTLVFPHKSVPPWKVTLCRRLYSLWLILPTNYKWILVLVYEHKRFRVFKLDQSSTVEFLKTACWWNCTTLLDNKLFQVCYQKKHLGGNNVTQEGDRSGKPFRTLID